MPIRPSEIVELTHAFEDIAKNTLGRIICINKPSRSRWSVKVRFFQRNQPYHLIVRTLPFPTWLLKGFGVNFAQFNS